MVLVDQSLQGLQETGAVGIREVEGEGVGAVEDRMALGDGLGAVFRQGRRAGLVEIQGPGQFIDGTETVSAAVWRRKRVTTGLVPRSIVSRAGTRVKALPRVVSPNSSSRTAPTTMRVEE